jgi:hypothetical protein
MVHIDELRASNCLFYAHSCNFYATFLIHHSFTCMSGSSTESQTEQVPYVLYVYTVFYVFCKPKGSLRKIDLNSELRWRRSLTI